ncbi:MAG: acetyl-CoA carboxylase carboxyltransferase subunit alpha [Deferribacteraceae bacterium]|jgi:acetyl-CoA carboxylase carboxyl transferase subunit alpha|nr:acetyl-CoA carboxylase carboxyltransferase subunit alpha [Deferribacteraceae bacterium]
MLSFEAPILELEAKIEELKKLDMLNDSTSQESLAALEKKLEKTKGEIYRKLTPIQRTEAARHPARPYTLDYIKYLFKDFVELHGDRYFGDDPAIVGGFAKFDGNIVMIVGHQKGHNAKENALRNFGMAKPEGYRKAVRLFKLAEKFHRPIITFVDTAGAYPGIDAEERGQAEAIARALITMSLLKTPILTIITGEGGSGGALGIAVANRVLMLENAVYSVISPEGCASILWGGSKGENVAKAAEALKSTAQELYKLKVIDEIIEEPLGAAHSDHLKTAANVGAAIRKHLTELMELSPEEAQAERYKKYRDIGVYA